MSSGSGFSNNDPHVAKQMSQAAIRIKALSQLRQVLRSSPTRAGLAYTLGKDLLILLRYLPTGLINKVQNFNSTSELSSSASSSSSGQDINDVSSSQSNSSSAPSSPSKNNAKKTNNDTKSESRFKILSMSVPTTPTKSKDATTSSSNLTSTDFSLESVLRNVLQMNTVNNAVIKDNSEEVPKSSTNAVKLTVKVAAGMDEESQQISSKPKELPIPTFIDSSEAWTNIEARTKYLVACLNRACGAPNESKHNVIQHLDDLFSHIYQYAESRSAALDAGAAKTISKVAKKYSDHSHIVGKSRELMALMGISPPTKGQGLKILSIDGGGVRGLVAVEVLRAIERLTNKKTHELFDYICGVSTGSIIAFLLGAHRHSLDDAEAMYKDLSREIFSQNSFWGNATLVWSHAYYHTPTFEKILKKHCGEVPLISLARDPTLPRVSAISTIVNQERVVPYVFRTYAFPPQVRAKYMGGCRYHMWEAVRASAAAPTYFEEFKLGNYLHQDGGIIVNNPTAVAIGEAKTLWKDAPIQCVVSLGTGLSLASNADKNLGEFIEQGEKGEKYLTWKGKFLKVLDSATDTESVHNTLNELLSPDIYFRFNPYLSEVVRLDETDPAVLERLQMETRDYLERNIEKVQYVCKTLLKEKGITRKVVDWWYHA